MQSTTRPATISATPSQTSRRRPRCGSLDAAACPTVFDYPRPRGRSTPPQPGVWLVRALARPLIRVDLVGLLQRQPDVVQPVEQAVLDLGVDVERRGPARPADLLRGEADLALPRIGD